MIQPILPRCIPKHRTHLQRSSRRRPHLRVPAADFLAHRPELSADRFNQRPSPLDGFRRARADPGASVDAAVPPLSAVFARANGYGSALAANGSRRPPLAAHNVHTAADTHGGSARGGRGPIRTCNAQHLRPGAICARREHEPQHCHLSSSSSGRNVADALSAIRPSARLTSGMNFNLSARRPPPSRWEIIKLARSAPGLL